MRRHSSHQNIRFANLSSGTDDLEGIQLVKFKLLETGVTIMHCRHCIPCFQINDVVRGIAKPEKVGVILYLLFSALPPRHPSFYEESKVKFFANYSLPHLDPVNAK